MEKKHKKERDKRKKKQGKRNSFFILAVICISLFFAFLLGIVLFDKIYSKIKEIKYHHLNNNAPEETPREDLLKVKKKVVKKPSNNSASETVDSQLKEKEYKEILNLKMDFFSQAPFANWDPPYDESCEEASILLIANELDNMNLNKKSFDERLKKIVKWEEEKFGSYEHTNVKETEEMIKELFDFETKVHPNPSFDEIKEIISRGSFIVAPFAGRMLNNPFYSGEGPYYHMMVIKGYDDRTDEKKIITHDVGTKRGKDYIYPWYIIKSAMRDYSDENIEKAPRKLIEVYKK